MRVTSNRPPGFGRLHRPVCLLSFATLLCSRLAVEGAVSILVTNLQDSGPGTLREAISSANVAGSANISILNAGIITLESELPRLEREITITGPGSQALAINGDARFRVLSISAGANVQLIGLSIQGGHTTNNQHGGGIYNQGMLTISNCSVMNNGAIGAFGGGIYSAGQLTVVDSTVSSNGALGENGGDGSIGGDVQFPGGGGGGGAGLGGGIFAAGGTVMLSNVMLTGNAVHGGNGGTPTMVSNVMALGGKGGDPNGGRGGSKANQPTAGGFGGGGGAGATVWVMVPLPPNPYPVPVLVGENGTPGGFGGGGGMGAYGSFSPGSPGAGGFGGGSAAPAYPAGLPDTGGGGAGMGGAIFLQDGVLTIQNCTISGNSVQGGAGVTNGGKAFAPGVFNYDGVLRIVNSTLQGLDGISLRPALITSVASGEGAVVVSPDRALFDQGELVTLTAQPGRWYQFVQWSDGETNNPRVIAIVRSNDFAAVFAPITPLETLTFNGISRTAPVGMPAIFVDGQFQTNTGPITRIRSAHISVQTSFTDGTMFFRMGPPADSSKLLPYRQSLELRTSRTLRAVALNHDSSASWESDPIEIVIIPAFVVNSTSRGGGAIEILPSDPFFLTGATANLRAVPNTNWTFLQWLGDLTGTDSNKQVVFTRDFCAEAVFGSTLRTNVYGHGRIISEPPASFYPYGQMVQLTAVPDAGYSFVRWADANSSTNNPLQLVFTNSSLLFSAAFVPMNTTQLSFTVLQVGNGEVMVSPRANRYQIGTIVALEARPAANEKFLGWSGDLDAAENPLSVTLERSMVIQANFTSSPRLKIIQCPPEHLSGILPIQLCGQIGAQYEIEQMTSDSWTLLSTFSNTYGVIQFQDLLATNENRFYRARQR